MSARKKLSFVVILLMICIFVTFSPALKAGYLLTFDDGSHFVHNTLIQRDGWKSVRDIFFTPDNANATFIPLTMLTFFYERHLIGLIPAVSHAINILLHTGVCWILFLFLSRTGISSRASIAAVFIFALHPLHVEPVAWITARKDLLYSFFFLCSMYFYILYIDTRQSRNYIFALATAALSILSKPMALSLPLIFFLLDWLKGRPMTIQSLLEKIPFFLVVEPVAAVTYAMNARDVSASWFYSPLIWVWSGAFYIQKFFCPTDLSILYSVPVPVQWFNPEYCRAVLVILLTLLLAYRFSKERFFLFATGFYILSQFFLWRYDIYDLTSVADRFMYLPSMGFCMIGGILIDRLFNRSCCVATILFSGLIVVLSLLSFSRSLDWSSPFALWNAAVELRPTSVNRCYLGESLSADYAFGASREDFIKYIAKSMGAAPARLKVIFGGSFDQKINAARRVIGIRNFELALKESPQYFKPYYQMGIILIELGRIKEASQYLQKAVKLSPRAEADIFYNSAVAHHLLNEYDDAMKGYNMAIMTDHLFYPAYLNRSRLRASEGDSRGALNDVLTALQISPQQEDVYDWAIQLAGKLDNTRLIDMLKKGRKIFSKRKT